MTVIAAEYSDGRRSESDGDGVPSAAVSKSFRMRLAVIIIRSCQPSMLKRPRKTPEQEEPTRERVWGMPERRSLTLERPPEALTRHPGPLQRIPGALQRIPGALGRIPGALGRIPGALGQLPGALGREGLWPPVIAVFGPLRRFGSAGGYLDRPVTKTRYAVDAASGWPGQS